MHHFVDFKGFADAEVDLERPLTVLIGPNGSGKSNVVEAMRLLSFLAGGGALHEIADVGRSERGIQIRGGLQGCVRRGREAFSLEYAMPCEDERDARSLTYRIRIGGEPEPLLLKEILECGDGTRLFRTAGGRSPSKEGKLPVYYNTFGGCGGESGAFVDADRSALSQYKDFARSGEQYERCVKWVSDLQEKLESPFIFEPRPRLMRAYERVGKPRLAEDGHNLSAILYDLHRGSEVKKEALERLLGWIRQLPEEPFHRFEFVTTAVNDVLFGFKEREEGPFIDARLLSDGTLRTLAVLTALETVERGSRLVIEEFDNGLHPSRVHVLTEALKSCSDRRDLKILVTTHNPATLDALQPDQMEGVVLCAWREEKEAFDLVRFFDLPRFDELLERGRLGDLVTRRVVERHLKPHFEEKRREKMLEWLRTLP